MLSARALLCAGVLLVSIAGCASPPPPAPPLPGPLRFSLLALGDTGLPFPAAHVIGNQYAVAKAMAREQRRSPVSMLLLLGDNFYPDGLVADDLTRRIRNNLVAPYCPFVVLEGPRSDEVRRACPEPAKREDRVAVLAVLGNHDHGAPESPALQRHAIPHFISNWHVPEGLAEVFEDPAGVSIILIDSASIRAGADLTPLIEALRGSQGPWRVLVAHHPLLGGTVVSKRDARYRERLLSALAEARAPVHLLLAGHEHNLQVIALPVPAPHLQVISGSGSRVEAVDTTDDDRRFASSRSGFARVDLVGVGHRAKLVASLFALPPRPRLPGSLARLTARYSVARDGTVLADPGAIVPAGKGQCDRVRAGSGVGARRRGAHPARCHEARAVHSDAF